MKDARRLTKDEQLNLCELLALTYSNGAETLENAEKIIDTIYQIAHLNGTCKNPHEDWHELGHQIGEELMDGIGDYTKERP